MPGIGSNARLIEKSDGYICSACRHGVRRNATACPYCNRYLRPPTAPYSQKFINLGVFIILLDLALLTYTTNVEPGMPLAVKGSTIGVLFAFSILSIAGGIFWDKAYPGLLVMYWTITDALRFGFLPLYQIGRWIAVTAAKCIKWCGGALVNAAGFGGRGVAQLATGVITRVRSRLKRSKPQKPTTKEKRMRAGIRQDQTSDQDSEHD